MASSSSTIAALAPPSSSGAASVAAHSASSPCAACKFLRRKCQPDCVFAPYFPPDNPQKFIHVHRVFGASNVTKLLNDLHPSEREDAVNSLAYEADMRLRDPVYGCVGVISVLQQQLRILQQEISFARSELSKYQSTFLANSPFAATSSNPAPVPSSGLTFTFNNGHPAAAAGQFFPGREHNPQTMMVMRNYEGGGGGGEFATRLGVGVGNNGAYESGMMTAINGSSAVNIAANPLASGSGQFLKPGIAGGDECKGMGSS